MTGIQSAPTSSGQWREEYNEALYQSAHKEQTAEDSMLEALWGGQTPIIHTSCGHAVKLIPSGKASSKPCRYEITADTVPGTVPNKRTTSCLES